MMPPRFRIGSLLIAVPLAAPFGLVSRTHAQEPPSYAETLVVSASLDPEEESELGAAVTVLTRERIVETGAATVLEALRLVPGADVVRAGGDGAVTSLFLRGAGSTGALVLVDGVRVNSPYFGGFDFSSMSTRDVEKIEIVRGPFSTLYGSDAQGGVVQIFTRSGGAGSRSEAQLEAGDFDQRSGSAFGSVAVGPATIAVTGVGARSDGGRPNSDWRSWSGTARADFRATPRLTVGVEGSTLDAENGVPGPEGAPTLATRGTSREERVAVPISFRSSERHATSVLLSRASSSPTFHDPNGESFGDSSTEAATDQLRWVETWRIARHTLSSVATWERWEVSSSSAGSPVLDRDHSQMWGVSVQDSIRFGRGWSASLGVRHDRHSAFGGETSPRATISRLSASARWKVRASAGHAFRAPSIGELFYPDFGNPQLEPERSNSYEVGVERYVSRGRAEASVFWNDFRNLIAFDFTASRNENIGLARTRGVEIAWSGPIGPKAALDAGYTYLDTEDLRTGAALARRPRHRAYVAATGKPSKVLRLTLRATWVGTRADVDALTFEPVTSPSYLRLDLFARGESGRYSPYLRVENLGDRRYEEADGYPAPGRRFAVGLDARL